jgi:hypothetical protein
MPESKHRRKNKSRPRQNVHSAPPPKNPEPSPTWVPATGIGLLLAGVIVIIMGYFPFVEEWTSQNLTLFNFGANWTLIIGFVLISVGFGFLTRWR